MIRVLIADDEKRIRDGLAATLPWAELGMEVVGTAAHGEAALELARQTRPHILVTDVRMPRLDGLELVRQARALLPRLKVIILSGYDDFGYAQQAVKLGVSEYLVKPVGADEVRAVLARLADQGDPELGVTAPGPGTANRLADAVRRGDRTAAYQALGEWRLQAPSTAVDEARSRAVGLVDFLIQDLRQDGYEFREGLAPPAQVHSTVLGLDRVDEVEAWLDDQVGALTAFVARNYQSNHRLIIQRALEFVEARYAGDLSVEQVAQFVGLSPNYFSHLFKKVRGQGFKDYLNSVRIAKAQALLAAGGHKVYEVAPLVGFSDYKYFAAVFKKVTGTSPTRR